jgi:uncharacterized hydrophobic protein (TIGR00271 family)
MSLKAPGKLVAVLTPDLDVTVQMRWAIVLARTRKLDLQILQRVESNKTLVVDVPLEDPVPAEGATASQALQQLLAEIPDLRPGMRPTPESDEEVGTVEEEVVHVELRLVYFESIASLRRALIRDFAKDGVELFTISRKLFVDQSDPELARERRLLLRYIPCEIILCQGLGQALSQPRVLVATAPDTDGAAALRLGFDVAKEMGGTLSALHVNPDVGSMAEQVGERRLTRDLERFLGAEAAAVTRRVVVDDQPARAVRRVWDEGDQDLVVVGSPRVYLKGNLGSRLGRGVPVVFVSAASPVRSRFLQFVEEGISKVVPQIEREQRVDLVDSVQSSAAWTFDYIVLMVLSTVIAGIGLIQNSAAVVIGAMLVAPLMTPLLGLGLALVQGNPVLARLALRSLAYGVGVALLVGVLLGFGTGGFEEPTREMLGRGGPGLLDILVAFAGGLAAAYASSRPSLIAALPGVAIAAALVPPIATAGLSLSLGQFQLAIGALLLFGINMVTIILAAMVGLWAVGFRGGKKTSRWTAAGGSAVVAAVILLGVYLSLNPRHIELTETLPTGLIEDMENALPTGYRISDVAVAYDELGLQLNVGVLGAKPAPESLAKQIRKMAAAHYRQTVRIRLLTRIELDDGSGKRRKNHSPADPPDPSAAATPPAP